MLPLREQPFIHLKQSNKHRTAEFQHAGLMMSHKTREMTVNKRRSEEKMSAKYRDEGREP